MLVRNISLTSVREINETGFGYQLSITTSHFAHLAVH